MTDRPNLDRRAFTLAAGAALLGAAPVAAVAGAPGLLTSAPALQTVAGAAFGTTWRIMVPGGARPAPDRAEVDAVLARIDRRMSPWRRDSDLTRFNLAAAGAHGEADEVIEVTAAALRIARDSGGAFDPTVGPLVSRWGFGRIEGEAAPRWRDLAIEGRLLVKSRPGTTLDLCGIAKGHAIDCLAGLLDRAGHTDFLIDFGGELRGRGRHPSGRSWRAGLEDPRLDADGLLAAIRLDDAAVATSGRRWNGFAVGGRTYSHIIDPATREPVEGQLASVSVIAPTAMIADGWATALMAAGDTAGPALARRLGLQAGFLFVENGALRRVTTGGFDDRILA